MRLAAKLNLKPGMALRVLGRPADVDLDDVTAKPGADGVLLFVRSLAALARHLQRRGVEPVRMVAVDEVWSAIRFRPAK